MSASTMPAGAWSGAAIQASFRDARKPLKTVLSIEGNGMRQLLIVALVATLAVASASDRIDAATPSSSPRASRDGAANSSRQSIAARYRGAAERLIGAALASDHAY